MKLLRLDDHCRRVLLVYVTYEVSAVMSSSTYHVAVELSRSVAAAGPVGLGDGLRCVGLDQTSPVNQTGTQTQR